MSSRRLPEPQPLPLFDAPAGEEQRVGVDPDADRITIASEVSSTPRIDPHLAAARRLSRAIRRTRARSPEEVRTGRLICRHLVAMLRRAEPPSDL